MNIELLLALDEACEQFLGRVEGVEKATAPRDPSYRAIHKIADAHLKRWANEFIDAIGQTRDAVLIPEISRAIAAADPAAIEAAIPWERFEELLLGSWQLRLRDIVAQAAEASVATLGRPVELEIVASPPAGRVPRAGAAPPSPPIGGKISLAFDLTNPRAIEVVEGHAANLVREVTVETRSAIRSVMVRAFEGELQPDGSRHFLTPQAQARLIKPILAPDAESGLMGKLMGLTERQANSVVSYADRLLGRGEIAEARIDKLVDRYAGKLLRDRAETIARTETLRGANEGQQLLWGQAQEQGLLDPERMRRKWLITPDDRLCELCTQMRGERAYAGMDEPFDFPLGPVMSPPGHPRCRCAVALSRQPTT